MSDGQYLLHVPETDDDIEQVYSLMRAVFKGEGVDDIVRRLLTHYPQVTLDRVYTVMHEDKVVAALVMIPQTWAMGGVSLDVAEMGCVATHPDYRRRGLQRILNDRFDDEARLGGYDLCALAGIPFFYRQFGYEYALDLDHSTAIPVARVPDYPVKLGARGFAEDDIPQATALLEESQARYYVHCPRSEQVWRMQHVTGFYNGAPFKGYSLHSGGTLAAYMRLSVDKSNGVLELKELGMASGAGDDVLGFLKRYAREHGLERIVSRLGYNDPLTAQIVGLGGETRPVYGWQIKAVDLVGLLRKAAPLLESRLVGTRHEGLSEKLNLNFRRFNVEVVFDGGRVKEVERSMDCSDRTIGLNPYVFPQLLLGYRCREELEHAYPDFRIRDSHKGLVDALFPKMPSYVHHIY